MTERQIRIVKACLFAVGGTLLFVPYLLSGNAMGYFFVGSPPHPMATLDMGQIVFEWVAIALGGSVAWLTYGQGSAPAPRTPAPYAGQPATAFSSGTLRVFRWIVGLLAFVNVAGLLPALELIDKPQTLTGEGLVQIGLKLAWLALLVWAFRYLGAKIAK